MAIIRFGLINITQLNQIAHLWVGGEAIIRKGNLEALAIGGGAHESGVEAGAG